jgi:penicillin amidase
VAPTQNEIRREFERTHGRRLPFVSGELQIPGLERALRIRRDAYGIPYVEAETEEEAFYGLGFCQGQDRSFQLEQLKRVARGTLSELVGVLGLPLDRLTRRIGFHAAASAQWEKLSEADRAFVTAFALGVNDGVQRGLPEPAHEFALLGAEPSPIEARDVLCLMKLAAMLLGSNWDAELARLRVLREDGLEALQALEPADPDWLPVTDPPGTRTGAAAWRLAQDAATLSEHLGLGGASNNWVLAPSRTASGRPLLANDPHLPPVLPAPWYLARLETPQLSVAGASFIGFPLIPVGHNGVAAWGATAALIDAADLFLEEIGPDGRSVREGESWVPCQVRREEIHVKGAETVIEEVLITPRGPIVGPAVGAESEAISLRASWLATPAFRLPRLHRAKSFAEFRDQFSSFNGPALNYVYADRDGNIGWQLTGQAPKRRRGSGTVPSPGWDPAFGWEPEPVAFEEMPWAHNPKRGFLATANNRPRVEGDGPFLGDDFVDGYRVARIAEALEARRDWNAGSSASLQLDEVSIPWREMRDAVLAVPSDDEAAQLALRLLESWDGQVSADAPAATVFELFVSEMARRIGDAKAPRTSSWALGKSSSPLAPITVLMFRRIGHLVRLLRAQPEGWFKRSWGAEIADALGNAVRTLRERFGKETEGWAWGRVRPLTFIHPAALLPNLAAVFNLGPMPWGGDMNTVAQAGNDLLNPTANAVFVASLRAVVDVGRWDEARFVLAGGQSGNPLSPHYGDQLPLWQRGESLCIAWTREAVEAASRTTLNLVPVEQPACL